MNDEPSWHGAIGTLLAFMGGVGAFLALWVYCTMTYGFLFGFGLGWLPSGIAADITAIVLRYLWFVGLLLAGCAAIVILRQ